MRRSWAGLALTILFVSVAPAQGQTLPAASAAAPSAAAADALVRNFLTKLLAAKNEEAADDLLAVSTTPSQRPDERTNLLNQIAAAVTAYGPIMSYEKARSDTIGTMATRLFYLVQHRDMVVRWEFEVIRTGNGWKVDNFAFDDQPRSWF